MNEDKNLMIRLKSREKETYVQLYDLYFTRLYRLAVHFVYDEEDAKDIVQQLFIDLLEGVVHLEEVRNLVGWLYMAVRNRCLNYLRAKDIEDQRKMLYLEASNNSDSLDWLEDEELIKKIQQAIAELPEKYRQICECRFYKCMKFKDIAEKLNISENAAKVQVHRLIQKIKDSLSPNDMGALHLLIFFATF